MTNFLKNRLSVVLADSPSSLVFKTFQALLNPSTRSTVEIEFPNKNMNSLSFDAGGLAGCYNWYLTGPKGVKFIPF